MTLRHLRLSLRERCEAYLAQGWPLIPILPNGKQPHEELLRDLYGDTRLGHLKKAPALPCEVEWWFENDPTINLAVIPCVAAALVIADVDRLAVLDPVFATPTASSGREGGGKHFYFSCEREVAMRKMAWGDLNPQYVLLPGSVHPEGPVYEWLPRLSPEEVGFTRFEEAAPIAWGSAGGGRPMRNRKHAEVRLPKDLVSYRDRRPDARQRRQLRIDGSETELRIVSILLSEGYSDTEIIDYFNEYALPRYSEEKKQSWLVSLIATARSSREAYVGARSEADDEEQHITRVIESEHNFLKQTYADSMLRFLVLRVRREAEEQGKLPILTEWRKEIIEVSKRLPSKPVSMSTARRLSKALIEHGYVRLEPRDKKSQTVLLTDKGRRAGTLIRGKWARLIAFPKQASLEDATRVDSSADAYDDLAEQAISEPAAPPPPAGGKGSRQAFADPARARLQAIARQRKYEQINDFLRLTFKGNRIRYIQLLTSEDDLTRALVWEQLLIGFDSRGLPLHATLCAEGEEQIQPLLPEHWMPFDRCFIGAVELERDSNGFHVAEYLDEHDDLRPRVGIIAQSVFNFFQPLLRCDPTNRILRVKGTGSRKTRMYQFSEEGEALSLPLHFDMDEFLDGLFDDQRIQQIRELPRGWFHIPPKRQRLVHMLLSTGSHVAPDRRVSA